MKDTAKEKKDAMLVAQARVAELEAQLAEGAGNAEQASGSASENAGLEAKIEELQSALGAKDQEVLVWQARAQKMKERAQALKQAGGS
jgi:hypothetical protein